MRTAGASFDQLTPVGIPVDAGDGGDFNHDGYPDFAFVSDPLALVVLVVQKNPPPPVVLSLPAPGPRPVAVALGDVNGDGHQDLVIGHDAAPGVTLQLGLAAPPLAGPYFGAAATITARGAHTDGVALADFDGDGRLDLAVRQDGLILRLGNGDGTFGPERVFSVSGGSGGLDTGDLDRDGNVDVALACDTANRVDLLLGDGAGGFPRRTTLLAQLFAGTVALADIDRDGCLDIAIGETTRPEIAIHFGERGGGFGLALPATDADTDQLAPVLGDLDADGALDLVSCAQTVDRVDVRLGDGGGDLSSPAAATVGAQPFAQALGDIDGDGDLDLAVANLSSDDVSILLGKGDGSFGGEARLPVGDRPVGVALGDIDGDGRIDLAVANNFSDDASVRLGTGGGAFGPEVRIGAGGAPAAIALADVDGDERLDLLVVNNGSSDVTVRLGTGDGGFGPESRYGVGANPVCFAVADLDGDGNLDIVSPGFWADRPSLLKGLGGGAFGGEQVIPDVNGARAVAAADIDGDGALDLVFGSTTLEAQEVYRRSFRPAGPVGRGDGRSADHYPDVDFLPSIDGGHAALGDLNGDGIADLAVLTDRGPSPFISGAASGSVGVAIAGAPGARRVTVPPLDLAALSSTALPRDRRYAQASFAYAFSPEGRALPAPAEVTLPLHARLTARELSEGVLRVFAEERFTWADVPRIETVDRRTGTHAFGRLREVARRDPGGGPLPAGVRPASVSETAGTITFPIARLERVQVFLEAPRDEAVLYRETFDGNAPFRDGIAPTPAGWHGVADWQLGVPLLNGRAIVLPTATSAPNLYGTRLRRPAQETAEEGAHMANFGLAPAPAGRRLFVRLRRAYELLGPGEVVKLRMDITFQPAFHVLPAGVRFDFAAFSGTSEGYPEMREETIEIPDSEVRAAIAAIGADPARGVSAHIGFAVISGAGVAGAGFFCDDVEVIVAP
jgi:hypothetical protein